MCLPVTIVILSPSRLCRLPTRLDCLAFSLTQLHVLIIESVWYTTGRCREVSLRYWFHGKSENWKRGKRIDLRKGITGGEQAFLPILLVLHNEKRQVKAHITTLSSHLPLFNVP